MARKIRSKDLETRSARLRLTIRKAPYFVKLTRGIALGYRRHKTDGTWVVRVTRDGADWIKAIGRADDFEEAGGEVFTFDEAQQRARAIEQGGKPDAANSVKGALDSYEADLVTRGGGTDNAARARLHLPAKLMGKAVAALTSKDLRDWRNALATKMTPASVNRTATALRAALNLAADTNERITNRQAWKIGLAAIPGAGRARNVILPDRQIQAIITAAYADSKEFGEFVEVIAVTGARPSQAARLEGEDVQANRKDPRLMMPTSKKGRGKKEIKHRPVPIPAELAKRLAGRAGQLLKRPDGGKWGKGTHSRRFAEAVKSAKVNPKLDPSVVTIYALRHSSIVRQLLADDPVPVRVVAAMHDTSVRIIETNYSEEIGDHADDVVRESLLETAQAVPTDIAKVVPIKAAQQV